MTQGGGIPPPPNFQEVVFIFMRAICCLSAAAMMLTCGCSSAAPGDRELSLKPSILHTEVFSVPYWRRVQVFERQDVELDVSEEAQDYAVLFTEEDVVMMAKILAVECPSVPSVMEQACVAWTICNRVDAGYGTLSQVMTAPNQFAYYASTEATPELLALAEDVLTRWSREKSGHQDVGRVLPAGFLWFSGDGQHNYFRNQYQGGDVWDYSLPNPYES